MLLPTQAQVATGVRYAVTIAGTAIAIFGLEAKGISADQVKVIISDFGNVVNDLVVLVGALLPLAAAVKGVASSSPTAQAAAVAASGAKVVTTPEVAAAVPSPNVMSETEVKVVQK